LTGLVAPHIDLARGARGYAKAYRELFKRAPADLYVILGVAHSTPPTPFVLTTKDYATPLGTLATDRGLVRSLREDGPFDPLQDEREHGTEHSIEYQTVFLSLLKTPRLLPVLCSSCDLEGARPGIRSMAMLRLMARDLRAYPGRVCLIAGVDLAHVGPCFGDAEALTPGRLARVRAQDLACLRHALRRDADGFLRSIMADDNKRSVCGVFALYAFLWLHKRLFPRSGGRLLHYGRASDPAGGEVTFASLAFS